MYECKVCGAHSKVEFRDDKGRKQSPPQPKSTNPIAVKRRKRAMAISLKNREKR